MASGSAMVVARAVTSGMATASFRTVRPSKANSVVAAGGGPFEVIVVLVVFLALASATNAPVASGFVGVVPLRTPSQQHQYRRQRRRLGFTAATARRRAATSPTSLQQQQSSSYQVAFEYCTGCRWGLRSFWMAQELLTTFQDDVALASVALVPLMGKHQQGQFRVSLMPEKGGESSSSTLIWDRKRDGGFPPVKSLKQSVRDRIDPDLFLGHSDTEERREATDGTTRSTSAKSDSDVATQQQEPSPLHSLPPPCIKITYCVGCKWMYRAAWFAEELLLSTFDEGEIRSLVLVPSRPESHGGTAEAATFTIELDSNLLWDRKERGGFPQIKELKRMIRDVVSPEKDLGHVDDDSNGDNDEIDGVDQQPPLTVDELDDDEAEEFRKQFGVA